MTDTRIERDSMGELAVPATALYGAQTQRAVNNFPVSGQRMPQAFVRALLLAKAAAARANVSLQQLDAPPVHRRSLKSRTSCSALSLDQP